MADASITAKFEFITTEQEIIDNIMVQFKDNINYVLRGALDKIIKIIRDRVQQLIITTPEVIALLNGELSKELGVIDPQAIINEIIGVIQNSIEYSYDPIQISGDRIIGGGYTFRILKSDFQDVQQVQGTTYITQNGVVIPWLNWLLFAGDAPVIYGYRVMLDPNSPTTSRTGAIMVKNSGENWSVPTEYSGTQDNNFLTRALVPLEEEIDNIIRQSLGL